MRTYGEIAREIAHRLGEIPAVLIRSSACPPELDPLWGRMSRGYMDNPIPALLKEKLLVSWSRHCAAREAMAWHLCRAWDLGASPRELSRLALPSPSDETLESKRDALARLWDLEPILSWEAIRPEDEACLLAGAGALLGREAGAREFSIALRRWLGDERFASLLSLLGYAHALFGWLESQSEPSGSKARVLPASWGALLREAPELKHWGDAPLPKTAFHRIPLAGSESFRQLADTVPDMIFRTGRDGMHAEYVNRWELEYSGRTEEEMLGKGWLNILHPEERESCRKRWRESVETGKRFEFEGRFRRKDGAYRWHLIRATPVLDDEGTLIHWIGACTDIHERVCSEKILRTLAEGLEKSRQELAHQKELLASVLDSMAEPVMVMDHEHKLLLVNPAAERMGCRDAEGMSARTIAETYQFSAGPEGPALPPEDIPVVRALRGVPCDDTELYVTDPSTKISRWIRASGRPIYDGEGRVIAGLTVFADITDHKESQRELERMLAAHERSNRELQHYGYIISHDLREPLRTVYMHLQLLARRYEHRLDPDALEFLSYAIDGAKRLNDLIDALLRYSKIASAPGDIVEVDASEVLDRALAAYVDEIAETRGRVEKGPLPKLGIDGGSAPLFEVFDALVSNAVKFRRPDVPLLLRIGAQAGQGEWTFHVSDNGIGIESQHFDRIFLAFQRLHQRSEYAGCGMGLAVCKKIVEQLGGRTWVESRPDEGSSFYFTLPDPLARGK